MYCKTCKRDTIHYQDVNGCVRCVNCGTVNKTTKKKGKSEVVFETADQFIDELNPNSNEVEEDENQDD